MYFSSLKFWEDLKEVMNSPDCDWIRSIRFSYRRTLRFWVIKFVKQDILSCGYSTSRSHSISARCVPRSNLWINGCWVHNEGGVLAVTLSRCCLRISRPSKWVSYFLLMFCMLNWCSVIVGFFSFFAFRIEWARFDLTIFSTRLFGWFFERLLLFFQCFALCNSMVIDSSTVLG